MDKYNFFSVLTKFMDREIYLHFQNKNINLKGFLFAFRINIRISFPWIILIF